jgi:hypothetical protein
VLSCVGRERPSAEMILSTEGDIHRGYKIFLLSKSIDKTSGLIKQNELQYISETWMEEVKSV